MAPEAKWIGCRNMNEGVGTPASYIECFEFFLAPYAAGGNPSAGDPAKAPHVINNSWECTPGEGCGPDALRMAVESARAAGILVVASAGNSGSGCGTVAARLPFTMPPSPWGPPIRTMSLQASAAEVP